MVASNSFIYIALAAGLLFTGYCLVRTRSLPVLAELFSLMLAVAAAHSGVMLCYAVLDGSKSLGDFNDQKLIIVLGAIAVFWVSLITSISLVQAVNNRATALSQPSTAAQDGS